MIERDWLFVSKKYEKQWRREAIPNPKHSDDADWFAARKDYAYFLRESGLKFREIGERLGVCANDARWKVQQGYFRSKSD